MDTGTNLTIDVLKASGGSGGASGVDEPIGSEYIGRSNPIPNRITVGAGGLHDPSSKSKLRFIIALAVLSALLHAREIEQDDDSSLAGC